MSGFDAGRFKANERAGFNRIAGRYLAGAELRGDLQRALVELAAPQAGERVLDLASGPCLLAMDAAEHVGADGLVVASDIAETMLATGRDAAAPTLRRRMRFCTADAERLPFAAGRFDLVLLGLGLFMLPDAAAALRELHRVLAPGGRLALSVWGSEAQVPLIAHAQACIARLLPPPRVPRPSVFRFGEPATLAASFEAAGFATHRFAEHRLVCRFADAAAYWQAFLDLAGGAAEALSRLPEETRQRLRHEVETELAACREGDAYRTDNAVLLALAQR